MKFLLSNYHYRPGHAGGGALHIEAFVRAALAAGHELHAKPSLAHPGVRPLAPGPLALWRRLRVVDFHYVRIQDEFPRPAIARWFAPPLRLLAPRPRLIWEFNTIPEQGLDAGRHPAAVARHRAAFARAAPRCDLAVCVSAAIADYARARLGIRRTLVVPNGGELRPAPAPPPPDGPFTVVWAGSGQIAWHDFDLILAAARLLATPPTCNPIGYTPPRPIHFVLYGPGTERLPDLPPHVSARGPAPHAEVVAAFARAHAALCLYRPGPGDYSSPLKFFDALAAGLPVLTSPQPQMDAIQRELGASSLIIADRHPATLAAALRALAADEPRRRRLALAAHTAIATRYNWPALMSGLLAHLSSLARADSCQRPAKSRTEHDATDL